MTFRPTSLTFVAAMVLSAMAIACQHKDRTESTTADTPAPSLRPRQAPPVQRAGPGRPLPDDPQLQALPRLPTTPIALDAPQRTLTFDNHTVEVTVVNPSVPGPVPQAVASNVCARLRYNGKTGWELPDERALVELAPQLAGSAELWSNVDLIQASGRIVPDPTTGETDLRQLASTVRVPSGAYTVRDHQLSDPSGPADFVCVRAEPPIRDWRRCMPYPALLRCECLGAAFVREVFVCSP